MENLSAQTDLSRQLVKKNIGTGERNIWKRLPKYKENHGNTLFGTL